MRWLMNYIRQCFCKHDFKVDEGQYALRDDDGLITQYAPNLREDFDKSVRVLYVKEGRQ